jgi:hypothetical protein
MNEAVPMIVNFKKITFFKRIIRSIKSSFILISIVVLGAYIINPSALTLLLWPVLVLYNLIESIIWSRFYITRVELNEKSQVKIEYWDNNVFKVYNGDLKSLLIEKKFVWYKIRLKSSYLIIKNTSSTLSLKQYEIKEWNNELMNKVILIKDNK